MRSTDQLQSHSSAHGFTLVELLAVLIILSVLSLALGNVVMKSMAAWNHGRQRSELLYQANFAMDRILEATANSRKLLIPLADDPATAYNEAHRDLLAVTLDPTLDRDNDGFSDADNDKDGMIDEDLPADNNNDGAGGLAGFDDDNDGFIDETSLSDNDEDGNARDDPIDGLDNDGDYSIDEDAPAQNYGGGNTDNDGDGNKGEDWYDAVVYFVDPSGRLLMERLPNVNPVDGSDYTDRVIARAENITLLVERAAAPTGAGLSRGLLLTITLNLVGKDGELLTLTTKVNTGRN